ncbi:hypothetical protein [Streptomyces collinus]|uniref:hypothetical protein n=1 Tax=Streptomyces collinus TaxID=42684 RepID=UPI0005BBBF44|nr:hypothetical protein [Streptomyces collinus]
MTLLATALVAGGATALALRLGGGAARPHILAATPSPASTLASAGEAVPSRQPATDGEDATTSQSPSGSPSPAVPATVTEADALLKENASLRGRVGAAVEAVRDCSLGPAPLREARKEFLTVADRRDDFVRRLQLLEPDANDDLNAAVEALSQAWTASASADRDYYSWASDVLAAVEEDPVTGCAGSSASDYDVAGGHNEAANKAKGRFARLWAPVAVRYGLTEVKPGDL